MYACANFLDTFHISGEPTMSLDCVEEPYIFTTNISPDCGIDVITCVEELASGEMLGVGTPL
jgi:hypothetical protein